jgi:muramidase (phage lysozyme)
MARITGVSKNLIAFLDLIAWAEGTAGKGDDGYNLIVHPGGFFTDYSAHPRKLVQVNPSLKSTAAGRYQLLSRYYDHYKKQLGLPDFSPLSQDKIAIQQIKEQRALDDILCGRIDEAIEKTCNIWASFPGAGYQQHEHSLSAMREQFWKLGGTLA